ncbi:fimbria/pilus outer membrane usher protein [Erwinia sorbitola]|uniref:Fimbria/pilus outer membrane usher protein n=1 Tax=Erwinia sorbitola TaxID=2681984 RepID=A0A6I6EMU7_9GAMM|nr:fimbria/pilus outer membrane usher protein [Erwinia sorbitola]MTD28823.1 fimbria/pilus outer membrane usher protein [Erwinia sorbitola]QGU89515.1 fimbria/pilus outer membrane usher protein [Erwinia sorbitola]
MLYYFINQRNIFIAKLTICFFVNPVYASDDFVEFSVDALDASDRNNIDLSRFSESNFVPPATYLLDLKVNGKSFSQKKITYVLSPENEKISLACLNPEVVNALAFKESALKLIRKIEPNCLDITTVPSVRVENHSGTLDITIPQAWINYSDPNWVPPERWDHGVPGLLMDYSISGNTLRQIKLNHSTQNLSIYGQAGANLGAWRFRADYQGSYSSDNHIRNFDWDRFYAYRPLPMYAARLTLGEIYMNSQVFDSVRFTGVNLASDERMLPPNLQGYAPQIRGIAKSNAKVTVSQGDHIIYETTVPAGPFNIQDLDSAVRGELDVRVEEQDGSVSTFQVNTANIPYLTRPGYIRYNASVGKPSLYNHKLDGPLFYSGDFSWGISNSWSLYGGTMLTGRNYNAWSAGVGRDMDFLGALSADATQSISKLPGERSQQGMSFKLSYAKTFDKYNSTITFAGYRFSQKKFRTLSQFLDERDQSHSHHGRDKEMYTITGNKTLWADRPALRTTLYLTYTHHNFWDRTGQDRYGFSAARTFRFGGIEGISTNLSLFRTTYRGRRDDSMSLTFSVPIGNSRWAGYEMQVKGSNNTHMASYSDNSDHNNLWRIRAGAGYRGKASLDSYYQHRARMAEMNLNMSYQQDNFISLGGSARGGLTATRFGAALHNSNTTLDAARIMVDTAGVASVPLNEERVRTNYFGIGVVPDIVSYRSFDTRIDVDAMDSDVEIRRAISTSTLTEGAIGYERFNVMQGEKFLAVIRLNDGTYPPFGSEISNSDGINVSMIMDNGVAYISGVKEDEKLAVIWEGKTQCYIIVPRELADDQVQILMPCQ